jgi:hypothetical protein
VRPILASAIATRAWGGSQIVLEGNRQHLGVNNEYITLGGDEGEQQIGGTHWGGV